MEHRRISSGKQPGCCEVCNLIPINENQLKKFECEDLQKKIDIFAKEAGFEWHVEIGNLDETMSAVCKEIPSPVTDTEMHDLDMQHVNFLKYIDVLEMPAEAACDDKENDLIDFGDEEKEKKNVEVIKRLLHDLDLPKDDDRHVIGATVIDATTIPVLVEPTCWGHIGHNTLKEMCELYLKAHSHE